MVYTVKFTNGSAREFENLSGADLRGAALSGANLSGTDLSKANLSEVDLSKADLSGANLRGAILRRANLSRVNLTGADLFGAILSNVDLFEANLSKANLTRAYFKGANLTGADLSEVIGIINPSVYIRNHFETTSEGVIAYKVFTVYFPPPTSWVIAPGSTLKEVCNPNPTTECGSGISVGTLDWIRDNFNPGEVVWKVLIPWSDAFSVVVPYDTNGKIRCGTVKLLEKGGIVNGVFKPPFEQLCLPNCGL